MNKQDLIDFVTNKTALNKKEAAQVVEAVLDGIVFGLKADKEVRFIGFGSFTVHANPARKGRNPRTGAEIDIAASNRPTFKAGKELRAILNN